MINKIFLITMIMFLTACSTVKKDAVDYVARDDIKIKLSNIPDEKCVEFEEAKGPGIFDIFEAGVIRKEQLKECNLYNENKIKFIEELCKRNDIEC